MHHMAHAPVIPVEQISLGPGMTLSEYDDCYRITANLAGLSMPELKVAVAPGVLTVRGCKPSSSDDADENPFAGYFSYSIGLPDDIDADDVVGWYEDDQLTLTIGRRDGW